MTDYSTPPHSPTPVSSPSWGQTTKLVVALTLVAIGALVLIQFRNLVGPLILAFILTYLLYPLVVRFSLATNLTWRTSVNLVFLIVIVVLAGLLSLTGYAIVTQIQSLIDTITEFVNNLPDLIAQLSTQRFSFGPFAFDFTNLNLETLANQALGTVQTLLGRMGALVSTLATTTASTLGWLLFVILVSYFLLANESAQTPGAIISFNVPGYNADVRRLGHELRLVWNGFLRGQLILILLVILSYTILLLILGLRYAFAIAILAGLARFVPYVGPLITVTVTALVAYFQGSNYFGLPAFQYTLLVLVLTFLMDQVYDNIVSPRLMGSTLGVHPAAVLVSALVATRWLGLIGLLLAAPVLASLQILGRYVVRKLFDLEPFPEVSRPVMQGEQAWVRHGRRIRAWWRMMRKS